MVAGRFFIGGESFGVSFVLIIVGSFSKRCGFLGIYKNRIWFWR